MSMGRTGSKVVERKDEQACIRKLNNRKIQKKRNPKLNQTAVAIIHGTTLAH